MSCKYDCSRHSAISRTIEIQGWRIDREDYDGAIGYRTVSPLHTYGSSYIRPTLWGPDGSRRWSFPVGVRLL